MNLTNSRRKFFAGAAASISTPKISLRAASSRPWLGAVAPAMGAVAVALAAVNVFGGFLVTRRMLEMFKKKDKKPAAAKGDAA